MHIWTPVASRMRAFSTGQFHGRVQTRGHLAVDLRDATIADVSNQRAVSDLGCMSAARYRVCFGELPKQTRLRRAK